MAISEYLVQFVAAPRISDLSDGLKGLTMYVEKETCLVLKPAMSEF